MCSFRGRRRTSRVEVTVPSQCVANDDSVDAGENCRAESPLAAVQETAT